jgi:hypothetical protein
VIKEWYLIGANGIAWRKTCRSAVSSNTNPILDSGSNETQVSGASLPWRLSFMWWLAIFVGPECRTCFVSLFWRLELWSDCSIFRKSVHLCTTTNFVLVTLAEPDTCFPEPNTFPAKGRTKCGSKNYFPAGALYRNLPIVSVAFLFELVVSCSASKFSYYQKGVNTFSKGIVRCFKLLVKLLDAFRSVLIASSFRFIFDLLLYSVLWKMFLLVEFTILFLLPPLFGCGVQLKRDGTRWRTVGEGEWRGNWRMEWVASTLHTTSEHGVSSITTTDAHTSAASSRLNWHPRRFKWARPFRRKTKSGFCACAITFQTQSTAWFGPWPPELCSPPFGVPQQLHSLKGRVVSQTPKPHPGGPGNFLSGLPYLSRECPVLRRQVFSLTHPMTGRIWWLQRQV